MLQILKKVVTILEKKDQPGFTELTSIEKGYDGEITMNHLAEEPKRDLRVEFNDEREAMAYLNRF